MLFGAGKIGRSFIGQLFSKAGFEVVFIDINKKIIDSLNERGKYQVIIKSDEGDELIWVNNVRGVLGTDMEQVATEVAMADIMAFSVGQQAIPNIAPVVAQGLEKCLAIRGQMPLDIILAENLRDAAGFTFLEIQKHLTTNFDLENLVGFVETSIGKMVPIMPKKVEEEDPLLVYAEPYNTLILDEKGFKNPVPDVPGLSPKANMPAWVDRKSFIHNLGHAAAAYYGYLNYPEYFYLHQVMDEPDVYEVTRATMLESADVLMKMYPSEFTLELLIAHIDDLIHRFSNKALGDTVYRVGQDLQRKLGPEDRLVGALIMALKYRMPYDKILYIIACAINFRAVDQLGNRTKNDIEFSKMAEYGISFVLEKICHIKKIKYPEIHEQAQQLTETVNLHK